MTEYVEEGKTYFDAVFYVNGEEVARQEGTGMFSSSYFKDTEKNCFNIKFIKRRLS